jgi:hypothetical protein
VTSNPAAATRGAISLRCVSTPPITGNAFAETITIRGAFSLIAPENRRL